MKTLRLPILSLLSLLSIAPAARAQWIGTGATTFSDYTTAANWNGGVVNDTFSNALGGAQIIKVTGSRTLAGGLAFTYSDTSNLTIQSATVAPYTFTLNGDVLMNVASGSSTPTVSLGTVNNPLNLDFNGANRTFNIAAPASNSTAGNKMTVFGTLANGSLTKKGEGSLALYGNSTGLTGALTVNQGVLSLATSGTTSGALTAVSSITVANTSVSTGTQSYAQLVLDNTGGVNNSRLSSTTGIGLNGGQLIVLGNASTAVNESFGTVTLGAGRNVIGVMKTATGASNTLTFNAIANANRSTLLLFDYGTATAGAVTAGTLGGVDQVKVTNDANLTSALIGGGGAAGTTTISILPWAAVSYNTSNAIDRATRPFGFLTYDSTTGFRALAASEYVTGIANSTNAADNVMFTANETVSANKTINSLFLNPTTLATLTIAPGTTLTVASGGVVGSALFTTTVSGGSIDFGANTGYWMGSSIISTTLKGQNGMVFAPTTTTTLNTAATYSGSTVVNSGQLTLGNSNVLPTATALRIDANAVVNVNGKNQQVASLAGNGTVLLGAGGVGVLSVGGTVGSAGFVTVNSGGSVAPGDPSGTLQTGTLYVSGGGIDFEVGSSLNIDLASASSFDVLNVLAGGAVINGLTLNVSLLNGYAPTNGQTWDILLTTTGITLNGTITGLPSGFTASVVGNNLELTYLAVPEPSTWLLLALSGSILLAFRARRKDAATA